MTTVPPTLRRRLRTWKHSWSSSLTPAPATFWCLTFRRSVLSHFTTTTPPRRRALNAAAAQYRSELNTDLDAAIATLAGEGITITLYWLDAYGLGYTARGESGGLRLHQCHRQRARPIRRDPDEYLFGTTFIRPPPALSDRRGCLSQSSTDCAASCAGTQSFCASQRGHRRQRVIGGFIINGTDSKQVIVRDGTFAGRERRASGQSPGRSGARSLPRRHPHHD